MDGADAKQQRIIMQAYDEQIRHARTQHAHEEYTARAKVTSDYRKKPDEDLLSLHASEVHNRKG
jgi:hypothetical protein